MKKLFILFVLPPLLLCSCGQGGQKPEDEAGKSLEHNKQIATLYHDLDPANIDTIFQADFKGHGETHDWDLESHRRYLGNDSYKKDSIIRQVAEGDWVATWFTRTSDVNGERVTVPVMHFKHFQNGKISELWEYYDYNFNAAGEEEGNE